MSTEAAELPLVPAEVDRRKFIGGSDIAALLNIAPKFWSRNSPLALYQDKIKPRVDEQPLRRRDVRRRGKRWEAAVAEMLVEELVSQGHRLEIISSNKRYTDVGEPAFACEIDFEIQLDGEEEITNVELKTVHPYASRDWGESESDDCPLYYAAQAMWGLGVTNRSRCLVAPLFGADELRTFQIDANAETIKAIRERARSFWYDNVVALVPPEPVFLSDLERLYPAEKPEKVLIADDLLVEKYLRLRSISAELDARQAEWDQLEYDVKRAMTDCEALVLPAGEHVAITWKNRATSHLDQTGLKEAHPKLVKEFTRKGQARVFTLKPGAWEK